MQLLLGASVTALTFWIAATGCTSQGSVGVEEEVKRILSACAEGQFRESSGIVEDSGWELTLSSGRTVTRSFLVHQAQPLVALGKSALEPLILGVETAEDPACRYIAIYALNELSGTQPMIDHLVSPSAEIIRSAAEEWRAGALER